MQQVLLKLPVRSFEELLNLERSKLLALLDQISGQLKQSFPEIYSLVDKVAGNEQRLLRRQALRLLFLQLTPPLSCSGVLLLRRLRELERELGLEHVERIGMKKFCSAERLYARLRLNFGARVDRQVAECCAKLLRITYYWNKEQVQRRPVKGKTFSWQLSLLFFSRLPGIALLRKTVKDYLFFSSLFYFLLGMDFLANASLVFAYLSLYDRQARELYASLKDPEKFMQKLDELPGLPLLGSLIDANLAPEELLAWQLILLWIYCEQPSLDKLLEDPRNWLNVEFLQQLDAGLWLLPALWLPKYRQQYKKSDAHLKAFLLQVLQQGDYTEEGSKLTLYLPAPVLEAKKISYEQVQRFLRSRGLYILTIIPRKQHTLYSLYILKATASEFLEALTSNVRAEEIFSKKEIAELINKDVRELLHLAEKCRELLDATKRSLKPIKVLAYFKKGGAAMYLAKEVFNKDYRFACKLLALSYADRLPKIVLELLEGKDVAEVLAGAARLTDEENLPLDVLLVQDPLLLALPFIAYRNIHVVEEVCFIMHKILASWNSYGELAERIADCYFTRYVLRQRQSRTKLNVLLAKLSRELNVDSTKLLLLACLAIRYRHSFNLPNILQQVFSYWK
ncbi:MAG: hypothetical protein GXO42_00640 [bacterium]|nr:hypothetical protein [bacterium]